MRATHPTPYPPLVCTKRIPSRGGCQLDEGLLIIRIHGKWVVPQQLPHHTAFWGRPLHAAYWAGPRAKLLLPRCHGCCIAGSCSPAPSSKLPPLLPLLVLQPLCLAPPNYQSAQGFTMLKEVQRVAVWLLQAGLGTPYDGLVLHWLGAGRLW